MKKSLTFAFTLVTALVIITALTLPSIAQATSQDDNYIVGGKRVGPVRLGESHSKYAKYLGPHKTLGTGFYDYPKRGYALLVKKGIITGIMVYSSEYKTKKGIKVGSSVKALVKHYGNYLKTDAGSLAYSDIGLAFNEKNGKISRIMVVSADPDPLLGDKYIEPGTRAGSIKLGMDIASVQKYWGKASSVKEHPENPEIIVYTYKHKGVKFLVKDSMITAIVINSYKFRTREGIGIKSSRDSVVKTYGGRFREIKSSIYYPSMGIMFYIHKDAVTEIVVLFRK